IPATLLFPVSHLSSADSRRRAADQALLAGPWLPPAKPLSPGPSAAPRRLPGPSCRHKGGDPAGRDPAPGASQLSATRTHPIEAAAPGPCWLRHPARGFPRKTRPPGSLPVGFLRLCPSSFPLRG
ncbi:Hypothetical predicted protein, partial [Marmota monax]